MKTALLSLCAGFFACAQINTPGQEFPDVDEVEWQPTAASIRRLIEALDYQGSPLASEDRKALEGLLNSGGDDAAEKAQKILDPYALIGIQINPESRVKVSHGPAKPVLVEQGWRTFLVKVHNQSGVTAELRATSPNAQSL